MPNHLRATGRVVRNRLLAKLPPDSFERLEPHLEHIALDRHGRLIEPGKVTEYVYFPELGMISLIVLLEGGATTEAGLIGNEGLVGIILALGSGQTTGEAIVQIPGVALRMPTAVLRQALGRDATLRTLVFVYLQALFVQVSQSVACNVHHQLRQRLARWLLTANDCSGSDEVTLSHESLSMMLGVQRQTVTSALGELKDTGIVATGHGRITIVDRKKLEGASCECYFAVRREYDRLLGPA